MMLISKSMYKVSYLLEQVIKDDLLLDNAAMFTVCNTVSSDHGEMNSLFGGQGLFQYFNTIP